METEFRQKRANECANRDWKRTTECKICVDKCREEIIFKTFSPFCKKMPINNADSTDLNDRGISDYTVKITAARNEKIE